MSVTSFTRHSKMIRSLPTFNYSRTKQIAVIPATYAMDSYCHTSSLGFLHRSSVKNYSPHLIFPWMLPCKWLYCMSLLLLLRVHQKLRSPLYTRVAEWRLPHPASPVNRSLHSRPVIVARVLITDVLIANFAELPADFAANKATYPHICRSVSSNVFILANDMSENDSNTSPDSVILAMSSGTGNI